jgi:hypothetical protein
LIKNLKNTFAIYQREIYIESYHVFQTKQLIRMLTR